MKKNDILFTFCDEEFTLNDCIGALCACIIFLAIFILGSTLESILTF